MGNEQSIRARAGFCRGWFRVGSDHPRRLPSHSVVGFNYIIVCAHFPDGGGVYSAARQQSRFLASVGALLLIANFLVTAALSGWAGVSYFGVPTQYAPVVAMGVILALGILNYFGPKHSGSVSIWLAVPAVIVVVATIAFSALCESGAPRTAPH